MCDDLLVNVSSDIANLAFSDVNATSEILSVVYSQQQRSHFVRTAMLERNVDQPSVDQPRLEAFATLSPLPLEASRRWLPMT